MAHELLPGDEEVTITVVRRSVTVVVFLGVDDEGHVCTVIENAPNGRDPTSIGFGDAFGFFFADQVCLLFVEEDGQSPTAYEREGISNLGPNFYDPDRCTIGSAEGFFVEAPNDSSLTTMIGTAEGQRLVRGTTKDDEGDVVSRMYMPCHPDDQIYSLNDTAPDGSTDPVLTGWGNRPALGNA